MPKTVRTPAQRGFTMIEIMIGLLISSVVLVGLYRMWLSGNEQSLKLKRKIELRNQIALSSKKLQDAITLAGFGMNGITNIEKKDGVGTDTLIIYSNQDNHNTTMQSNYWTGQDHINVSNASIFSGAGYVAISDGDGGEIRKIKWRSSNNIGLYVALTKDYAVAGTVVMPVFKEKYYTDQANLKLMMVADDTPRILGSSLKNFQVAFKDKDGNSTTDINAVRAITFSFTGIFPAKEGELSSITFTSTAIPRNLI